MMSTPVQKKLKVILKLRSPRKKQELQSFLGTVNFTSTFIPILCREMHMICSLLKKSAHFVWTSDLQQEFSIIKKAITNAVQMLQPTG